MEAEPLLSGVVVDLQNRGVQSVGSLVLHGDPADALPEAATALGADLLMLSSRGESGVRRAVMGSVAEHLLREAKTTAVMISPATADMARDGEPMMRRIILTLDGSETSEIALPHAEHLARVLQAELTLLRVDDEDDELKIAEAELRTHAAAMRSRGLDAIATQTVRSEDPATAILNSADLVGASLIVMASHGRGGIGRLLLGSVADSVARRTEQAAVLLVRSSPSE